MITPALERGDACLSDLLLDRHRVGELKDDEEQRVRGHVEQCDGCRQRLLALQADAAAFERAGPRLDLLVSRPRRIGARVTAFVASLAAAAAILIIARPQAEPWDDGSPSSEVDPPASPDQTRSKGKPRLDVSVRRGATVFDAEPGSEVFPGNALRFRVSTPQDAHLAIVSHDGGGNVSVYWPSRELEETRAIGAGGEQALDNSIILDDVLGDETIYAVFCDAPRVLEVLTSAVKESPRAPIFPPGCEAERFVLHKRAVHP